jgi:hypothetical protein
MTRLLDLGKGVPAEPPAMGLVVLGGASSSCAMSATKPRACLGFRWRARRGAAELHGGAETGEEEAMAPNMAREGEEGGGPGARMPLGVMGRSSGLRR